MFVLLKSKKASTECFRNKDHPSLTDIKFTQLDISSDLCEVTEVLLLTLEDQISLLF